MELDFRRPPRRFAGEPEPDVENIVTVIDAEAVGGPCLHVPAGVGFEYPAGRSYILDQIQPISRRITLTCGDQVSEAAEEQPQRVDGTPAGARPA